MPEETKVLVTGHMDVVVVVLDNVSRQNLPH